MAILSTAKRKTLPKQTFGIPSTRSYPMPDASHAANAKARATQMVNAGKLSSSAQAQIMAKANKVLGNSGGGGNPGAGGKPGGAAACPDCGKTFSNPSALARHTAAAHGSTTPVQLKRKPKKQLRKSSQQQTTGSGYGGAGGGYGGMGGGFGGYGQ